MATYINFLLVRPFWKKDSLYWICWESSRNIPFLTGCSQPIRQRFCLSRWIRWSVPEYVPPFTGTHFRSHPTVSIFLCILFSVFFRRSFIHNRDHYGENDHLPFSHPFVSVEGQVDRSARLSPTSSTSVPGESGWHWTKNLSASRRIRSTEPSTSIAPFISF